MKFKFPLVAAFVALLSLAACGGGGSNTSNIPVANPPQLNKIDTLVGTGTEATNGKTVTVTYTGWLYTDDPAATGHRGTKFDSGSFSFVLGAGAVIAGFDQGVLGMKMGGKRTIEIPSNLAYGSAGSGSIPPNAGLVFDVELTNVQ